MTEVYSGVQLVELNVIVVFKNDSFSNPGF